MRILVDFSSTFKPDKLNEEQLERGKKAMIAITTAIRNKAREKLKVRKVSGAGLGGRYTGTLAKTINAEVRLSHTEIEGTVKTGVGYAKFVEGWNSYNEHIPVVKHYVYGEKGSGIYNWFLRRHLIKTGSKQRFFWVGGPESITPFLEPTFLELLPEARQELGATLHGPS